MIQYLIIRIIESSGQTYTEATKVRDNQTNTAVEVNNKGKGIKKYEEKNKKSSRLFIFRK
ncbi:DUF1381 domain-containing protein [Staphylococcus pseudintermedius]|nr:DUF1381 domain-containing protein [Staphylococcus pseudintermedius]